MNLLRSLFGALSLVMLTEVYAHHSAAGRYDVTQTVEISGIVSEFRMISPHSVLVMNVTESDGSVTRWVVELSSGTNLKRGRGWSKDTFKPGDLVTVQGAPHRNGEPLMVGREFTMGGKSLTASRPPSVEKLYPPDPGAKGLSGRWLPPWRGQGSDPDRPPGTPFPLTDAGREAWKNYTPENSPVATCEPMNIPTLFYPAYLFDLRVDSERVVLTYELYDVVRTISLNGKNPQVQVASGALGVAKARMEGEELVIESSEFPPSLWGLAIGVEPNGNGGDIPSSDRKRVVERYSVSADGLTLNLNYTVEDPVYLTEPYSAKVEMARLSDKAPMEKFSCDKASASGFLGESYP